MVPSIDPEQVRKLAGWGLTQNDIASFVGCSQSLISLRFSSFAPLGRHAMKNGVEKGHGSKAGNTSNWLGKDRDEIAGANKRLEDLERDLAAAYARWHALEEDAG